MIYCTACGEELHDQAIICPKCGVATAKYDPATKLTQKKLTWFYILAVFMPMIGMALGIYALIKEKFGHGLALIVVSCLAWAFWREFIFVFLDELGVF